VADGRLISRKLIEAHKTRLAKTRASANVNRGVLADRIPNRGLGFWTGAPR
jgi:hypothetical protein